MGRLRWVLFISSLFFASLIAVAQSAPTSSQNQQPTSTFVSRTELVYVPVVVRGKDGKHLAGLTKDVFTVQQDGTAQQVAVFEEVTGARGNTSSVAPAAPGTATNFSTGTNQQLTVIVLDALNTPMFRQATARDALVKYLGKSLRGNHPIALFTLNSNGLHQIYSFSEDPALLVKALQRIGSKTEHADKIATGEGEVASLEAEKLGTADPMMAAIFDRLITMTKELNVYYQEQATRTSLTALQQLAGALAGVPGRKSLVWVTAGFPFILDDPRGFNNMGTEMIREYEQTWKLLNSAAVAVYPVDVTGLESIGMTTAVGTYGADSPVRGTDARRSIPLGEDRGPQQQATLVSVADATGGKAFINRNDLELAFAEAEQDSASYYMLGYYLKGPVKPGWHKLSVKVSAPHGQLRSREGFYVGAAVNTKDKASRHEFLTALAGPIDYTGVHFASQTDMDPQSCKDGKCRIVVDSVIPPQSLVIDRENSNYVDFDVTIMAVTPEEKYVADVSKSVQMHLKPESLAQVMDTGITYRNGLQLPPGNYQVRVAIRDNQTGNIGTVRTNLTVPAIKAQ